MEGMVQAWANSAHPADHRIQALVLGRVREASPTSELQCHRQGGEIQTLLAGLAILQDLRAAGAQLSSRMLSLLGAPQQELDGARALEVPQVSSEEEEEEEVEEEGAILLE
mmetsp:Transcript_9622/g.15959  ORF Transcript_9622/g.15959 Transcript_9622/m.15959 type:complete len:111 (-) Transcript_9622:201-533(-)